MKHRKSFRFSTKTVNMLDEWSERLSITQTGLIEIALWEFVNGKAENAGQKSGSNGRQGLLGEAFSEAVDA
jgi:hypothetical protein